MCGIAGIYYPEGQKVESSDLKRMGETQVHRGPDHFGVFCQENLGMVHNRLSILDLSAAGNQPMKMAEGVLCYNGEIYNYQELGDQLIAEGVKFEGTSDTEVLFHALIRFGVEATLKKARGMFAFSFFSFREKKLYLCRDRYGIKPLFWNVSKEGNLYWGSEVKAIKSVSNVSINRIKTFYAALGVGDHSSDDTLFDNVQHVPVGSYLVFSEKDISNPSTVCYYDILDDIDEEYYHELDSSSEKEIIDRLDHLLNQSVKRMLVSDVPAGVFLSGGIDSSLISGISSSLQSKAEFFTCNVLGQFSEHKAAKKVADHLNQTLHATDFAPETFLRKLALTTHHYECPIVTHANSVPFMEVAHLAQSKGVKPVLTGEGADEIFLGYPELFRRKMIPLLSFPIRLMQKMYDIVPGLKGYLFAGLERRPVDELELIVMRFERQRLKDEARSRFHFVPKSQLKDQCSTIQMIREGLISLLHRNDRMGMANSIESRFPFLDEEVIRFGINLPVKWKMKRSLRTHDLKHLFYVDKWPLREVAKSYLPKAIVQKPKKGFPIHGYRNLKVKPGYFQRGFLKDSIGMTDKIEAHFFKETPPAMIAKYVMIEVFYKMFEKNESMDTVTEELEKYVVGP